MRITLSQPSADSAKDAGTRSAFLRARLVGTILFGVLAAGCNRVDLGAEEAKPIANTTVEQETDQTRAFEWPVDPSHPTLEIEIAPSRNGDGEGGTIVVELMPQLAPATVAQVVDLATSGYYDGTTFHRVIPGFMIQGGDPNSRDRDPSNDGNGNPDLRILDEFGDAPFIRGVVGMGNKGRPNSTGGQFFIMHADNRSLDGRYTAIGRVVSGIHLVDAITERSIDRSGRWGPRDRPIENITMTRVWIAAPSRVNDSS